MGTKNNPGAFDCHAKAEPDEPVFVLLGRDDRAPTLVRAWAAMSEQKGTNPAKVAEARRCADDMRAWRYRSTDEVTHDDPTPFDPALCCLASPVQLLAYARECGEMVAALNKEERDFSGDDAHTLAERVRLLASMLVEQVAQRERGERHRLLVEARAWVRRLTATEHVLICAFCGEAYPPGTPESNHEALASHIRVCAKHPMREVEEDLRIARQALAALPDEAPTRPVTEAEPAPTLMELVMFGPREAPHGR